LLYGWDSRTQIWHGPSELDRRKVADAPLLQMLERVPGRSWYGPISCGAPLSRFFVVVHDLQDCGTAAIYCDESKTGPAEVIAVIPACRRSYLRDEFAFEFLAFVRFLGCVSAGAELRLHEELSRALATASDAETMVLAVSSGWWPSDLDLALSCCTEKIALALCRWLEQSTPSPTRARR
jgi:hypothetical protein